MDKLKAGAEQAKNLAGEAATRAKEEARDLQLKRDLSQAYDDLGKAAFDLAEQGALAHADLDPHVSKIRALKDELAKGEDDPGAAGEDAKEAAPEESKDAPAA
jgi:hypothetical protein